MNDKFSVIIPVLNESKNIEKLTKKIFNLFNKFKFEIIFVDDNSLDGSKKILIKLKRKYKNFNFILRKNKKKDLSKSCIDGFEKAKYQNIIVMDGDLQHDPKYLNRMSNIFIKQNLDFLVGVRDFSKFSIKGVSLTRYWCSKIFILFFNPLIGSLTSDPMSGYFIFKKTIYIKEKKNLYGHGYKILADLLYSGKSLYKCKNFKIKFNYRVSGKSKMSLKILIIVIIFILKVKIKSIFK